MPDSGNAEGCELSWSEWKKEIVSEIAAAE
jgi:hypothetical protein